jgi:hypothetical protein
LRRIPGVRPAFRLGSSQQMQNISTVPIASPARSITGAIRTRIPYAGGSRPSRSTSMAH